MTAKKNKWPLFLDRVSTHSEFDFLKDVSVAYPERRDRMSRQVIEHFSTALIILFLSLFCLIFLTCSTSNDEDPDPYSTPTTTPTSMATPTPESSDLDQFIIENMAVAHLPGLAAGIIKHNTVVWAQGYGWAHIENEMPVSVDTLFMLASVSKTVTLTAVMQIWEDGLFSLDEDVNLSLSFPVHNPHYPDQDITFRQLLTHTSSIKDNWDVLLSVYTMGDSPLSLEYFMENYFSPSGEFYDSTKNFYSFQPGEHHSYCNQAVTLAGYLVEVITSTSFEENCQNRIFDPLGMATTSWHLADLDLTQVAMPYGYNNTTGFEPYGYFCYPDFPAGGLRTSVMELARFLIMFINFGEYQGVRILQRETVELIRTRQVPDLHPNQALIWFYNERDGLTYLGHGGSDFGVNTMIRFRPADGVGVIVLSNGDLAGPEASKAFNAIIYRLFDEASNY
ncbi:serine hydrolase domain-containing protein [candidate division CSSED10-310 bacterium]|uniref:Serine hydrolase domain-containing protein n=1 Tax=candidate division CSSED10-310 bacterium TaxID=2855610 RepID=A0ABV6Z5E2_UNCC1